MKVRRILFLGGIACTLLLVAGAAAPAGAAVGDITEFKLQPRALVHGIVTGPDGNLWFTDCGADRIGRVTPEGVITEFGGPAPDSCPAGITAGADGNLWFVASETGKTAVGTFSPYSPDAMTIYPVDMRDGGDITPGPDGNVWFSSDGSIWRIIDEPAPALRISPRSGPPATVVRTHGERFGSFETVRLTFIESETGPIHLGRITTDATGSFTKTVTIPTRTVYGGLISPGLQPIQAKGTISRLIEQRNFDVVYGP